MAFHGTASVLQGTPWHSMDLHDIPWNFMAFHGTPSLLHGTPWNSMAFHGTPWILHGTPWHSMELHGYSMDTPWKFRGIPWISIYFHGIPWISIDFHGFPWNSMEVFHTGNAMHLCSAFSKVTSKGAYLPIYILYKHTHTQLFFVSKPLLFVCGNCPIAVFWRMG